jgi:hypothetical protein
MANFWREVSTTIKKSGDSVRKGSDGVVSESTGVARGGVGGREKGQKGLKVREVSAVSGENCRIGTAVVSVSRILSKNSEASEKGENEKEDERGPRRHNGFSSI